MSWLMPCAAHHFIHAAYWCDFVPFRQGCHRPSSSAFCRSVASAGLGTRHSLLLTVFFLPRSLNHCASACHSSINRLSGLHPSFNCCAYSALFSDLLARHCCRWCRIRTCGVPHIPDTCVPAFVHSANHLSVYLTVSPRRSPSCTMRSSFIFG